MQTAWLRDWLLAEMGESHAVVGATLPPRMYEIINCAIAATALIALAICVRYLVSEFVNERRAGCSWFQCLMALGRYRLAVGFTIFLAGEFPRMTWVWLARYITNSSLPDPLWMGHMPWVIIPVVSSALSVVGMACIVRALIPSVWGRYGYVITLGFATWVVVLSQIIRP